MTSHDENGPVHCLISIASQCPKIYLMINESKESWNDVISWERTSTLLDIKRPSLFLKSCPIFPTPHHTYIYIFLVTCPNSVKDNLLRPQNHLILLCPSLTMPSGHEAGSTRVHVTRSERPKTSACRLVGLPPAHSAMWLLPLNHVRAHMRHLLIVWNLSHVEQRSKVFLNMGYNSTQYANATWHGDLHCHVLPSSAIIEKMWRKFCLNLMM